MLNWCQSPLILVGAPAQVVSRPKMYALQICARHLFFSAHNPIEAWVERRAALLCDGRPACLPPEFFSGGREICTRHRHVRPPPEPPSIPATKLAYNLLPQSTHRRPALTHQPTSCRHTRTPTWPPTLSPVLLYFQSQR